MERKSGAKIYPGRLRIPFQYLYRSFFGFAGLPGEPYGKGRYPGYKTVRRLCGQYKSQKNTRAQKQTGFQRSIYLFQDMAVF